jgi:hypothetical protein
MDTNVEYICKGWNRLAFHFKPINTVRLRDERKTKKMVEGDVRILEARTGDSLNPGSDDDGLRLTLFNVI